MTVLRIGHIEMYAADRPSAVDYFVSAFNFTDVAHARTAGAESSLLECGDVRLIVTDGPSTAEFIERHGDGIADIAFVCDDVDATRERALRAGARPVGETAIEGFGAVRHSLLPESTRYTPPPLPWTAAERPGRDRPRHILALDHIAGVLTGGDLHERVAFYIDALGFHRYSGEFIEIGSQAMDSIVVRNDAGTATFTFLEPVTSRSAGQLDAFLERNQASGVQHLAFLVDDVVAAVRDFEAGGVEFLSTPGAYYDALADRLQEMSLEIADLRATNVLADRDEWGYLLQLFTRSPYPRNTLFYELIQRRGGRGFGSANIRALYEAVERDRVIAD
ncbi:4-hydroxyphenylpyruvate dioxygenase [Dactylosporangium siamense]|uniref:4-hydroxyphenylpyruvate dioxygenase n=1 Tax=Dactylosporangium siamense TaxID=685454 RepID=A0A919PXA8_9ACTN|nr:4-hydroxyphenylpyruvate dioxygenase [Dactylosporangium siamense]GIG52485.1 4-hydroxyphenylpyruvate dioxygenase [Dactylosporangium siamense]